MASFFTQLGLSLLYRGLRLYLGENYERIQTEVIELTKRNDLSGKEKLALVARIATTELGMFVNYYLFKASVDMILAQQLPDRALTLLAEEAKDSATIGVTS